MSYWRRMEKISWTDRLNDEAVLHRVKKERNILQTIRRRKANWIGHILRGNCLLSNIIEGKIVGTRRRRRRCKQLLDDLKEARRCWKLKEEAQDRTLCRTHFEKAMDLSQNRLLLDYINMYQGLFTVIKDIKLRIMGRLYLSRRLIRLRYYGTDFNVVS
jgi:hypothetical protein